MEIWSGPRDLFDLLVLMAVWMSVAFKVRVSFGSFLVCLSIRRFDLEELCLVAFVNW